jgi:hypothetical protein
MQVPAQRLLAHALAAHPHDLGSALATYERIHRKRLQSRYRGVALTSHLLVPATRTGTTVRNTAFRMWPRIAAAG